MSNDFKNAQSRADQNDPQQHPRDKRQSDQSADAAIASKPVIVDPSAGDSSVAAIDARESARERMGVDPTPAAAFFIVNPLPPIRPRRIKFPISNWCFGGGNSNTQNLFGGNSVNCS